MNALELFWFVVSFIAIAAVMIAAGQIARGIKNDDE